MSSDVWTFSLFSASFPVRVNISSSMLLHPNKKASVYCIFDIYMNLRMDGVEVYTSFFSPRGTIMHHDWVLCCLIFLSYSSFFMIASIWPCSHYHNKINKINLFIGHNVECKQVVYNCVEWFVWFAPRIMLKKKMKSELPKQH